MRDVSKAFSSRKSAILREVLPDGVSANLVRVADAFVQLHQKRQAADYRLDRSPRRKDAEDDVATAEAAFKAWPAITKNEADVFLYALLLGTKHWSEDRRPG